MRQKAPAILTLLLFAIGICVLLYPLISDWYNGRAQTKVIEDYEKAVDELDEEDFTALRESARTYNEGLLGNVILTDPFDESALSELSEEYESLININGDGVMGYVRIPKIDIRLPVYHGTSTEVLKKGAGHLENTSLPVGGAGTHSVISAHTGFPTATLFTNLIKMEQGDLFFLEILGETLAYRVDQVKTVDPLDTSDLLIDRSKDYVTLVTCTPYGINSHRLLVRGERTDYVEALEAEAEQAKQGYLQWNWPYIIAGIVLVLVFAAYAVLLYRRKEKKEAGDGKSWFHAA